METGPFDRIRSLVQIKYMNEDPDQNILIMKDPAAAG
jgi:hypothetical protein